MMETYMAPRRGAPGGNDQNAYFGFVVKDAPWNAQNGPAPGQRNQKQDNNVPDAGNDNDFPDLGMKSSNSGQKAWGPWGAH